MVLQGFEHALTIVHMLELSASSPPNGRAVVIGTDRSLCISAFVFYEFVISARDTIVDIIFYGLYTICQGTCFLFALNRVPCIVFQKGGDETTYIFLLG